MNETTLQSAGFVDNPFRIVPPAEMDNVIWAGDTVVVDELMDAAESPRADVLGTSELVVVFGEFGSGKTNALKYVRKRMRENGALVAYLIRPTVADKPAWHDVARSLFTVAFQRDDLAKRLRPLRKHVLVEASKRARANLGDDADTNPDQLREEHDLQVLNVAERVLPESPGFVLFAMDLADEVKRSRNWSYLADKPSKAVGQAMSEEYNLPADGMSSDYGASLILSNLIRTLTYETPYGAGTDVMCILMDEVEGLPDLPPVSRLSILQGIRDVFNAATEHLFIGLAATASDASEMWGILDASLMQRISRDIIQFPILEADDAKRFLLDVMAHYRTKDFDGAPEWPFSDDGLGAFTENCPRPITPRKLLVSAGRLVLQKAADKVRQGQPIEASDVYDFTAWGAN